MLICQGYDDYARAARQRQVHSGEGSSCNISTGKMMFFIQATS